jgi:beta-galactosidase
MKYRLRQNRSIFYRCIDVFKNYFIKFFILTLCLLACIEGYGQKVKHTFSLGDSTFLLDGKPFLMISGELHYPRIPKEAWRHRMKMAKAMGLNTIGTYVFWNLHEPEKGVYDFNGNNDIAEFVRIAQEEGLWVVLRPSPYICAEWEFGGYPYWLQKEEGLIVRSREPKFLNSYKNYIQQVAKQLAPLQVNHGGNILMVQVENEYGFYSNDKEYLKINKNLFVDAGFDGLLYTCDPAAKVKDGHLPGLLPAVNGLDNPAKIKSLVRQYHNGKGPFYIAEWYPAWFDWWGTPHHTVPAEKYTSKLDSILAAGISINMYMFHGGTTRGFMNGANYNDKDPYEPQISSYDYDAPLDEAGNITEKFIAFRDIIEKYLPPGQHLPSLPKVKESVTLPPIILTEETSLFDILPTTVSNNTPLTFEDLNQAYGFVLYRTRLNASKPGILKVKELRDYALVFVNGKRYGVLDRRFKQDSLFLHLPKGEVTLDILVENLGRVNFGPYLLKNKKGITEKVTFNQVELRGWQMFQFPFNDVGRIKFSASRSQENIPVVKRGSFELDKVRDTYLNMSGWGKGSVWLNGHHLGRYWSVGPQQTLYVPAEWLRVGNNEVIVLELNKSQKTLTSTDKPILNSLTSERTP